MPHQNQPSSTPLPSQQEAKTTLNKPRFARVRRWLRSHTRRVLIPLITLLMGIVLGITEEARRTSQRLSILYNGSENAACWDVCDVYSNACLGIGEY